MDIEQIRQLTTQESLVSKNTTELSLLRDDVLRFKREVENNKNVVNTKVAELRLQIIKLESEKIELYMTERKAGNIVKELGEKIMLIDQAYWRARE